VVTPEGFPLTYEVMAGNTSDKTTLKGFIQKIESLYGKAQRVWVMDRGIPTEEVLAEMRASDPPISYLVGTPKGRLSRYEEQLLDQPWRTVREGVEVKLLPQDQELYVLARSQDRVKKERAMRRRQLKGLFQRLRELQKMDLKRDDLLLKLGAAKHQFRAAWRLLPPLKKLARAPLVIVDDLGIASVPEKLYREFLEMLDDRQGQGATLITSQFPVNQWHEVIADPTVADAILDRLVHNAYRIELKGESMRKGKTPPSENEN
jgi:hypothetical protein